MPEGIPVIAVRDQQLVRDGLPDRLVVLGRGEAGRLADDVVLHPAARHGGGAQHLLGRRRELLDPREQQGGESGGQRVTAAVSLRGVPSGGRTGRGQRFLGVVRG